MGKIEKRIITSEDNQIDRTDYYNDDDIKNISKLIKRNIKTEIQNYNVSIIEITPDTKLYRKKDVLNLPSVSLHIKESKLKEYYSDLENKITKK